MQHSPSRHGRAPKPKAILANPSLLHPWLWQGLPVAEERPGRRAGRACLLMKVHSEAHCEADGAAAACLFVHSTA
jgi:hypothetical protein